MEGAWRGHGGNRQGMLGEYARDKQEYSGSMQSMMNMCMGCARNMQGICWEYVGNTRGICREYSGNM
jgi:hypothetical protein